MSYGMLDVGNTAMQVACFASDRDLESLRWIRTAPLSLLQEPDCEQTLAELLGGESYQMLAIASVVPSVTERLLPLLKQQDACPVLHVRTSDLPLRSTTGHPCDALGVDRALGVLAARFLWPAEPCIVIDYGTATTFDVITPEGLYGGGLIAPGLQVAFEALLSHTALLGSVPFPDAAALASMYTKGTLPLIHWDTQGHLYAGSIHGTVSMRDGLVQMFQDALGWSRSRVIETGGFAALLKGLGRTETLVKPQLIVQGMLLACNGSFSSY